MRGLTDTDREIAALVDAQHGVVARRQLVAHGLGERAIDHRIRTGRLRLLHRGVYAAGHEALRREGRWMAAVLACGDRAVLSHASAAMAWDLRRHEGAIHVTIPGTEGPRRPAGVSVHRSRTLTTADTTTHRSIPITTPARTILDLSATLSGRPLEHALDLADQQGLVDFAELRARGRSRSLKAVLAGYAPTVTRSELENRFLALCADHSLPRPAINTRIEADEVDFRWPDARLVVEVDGYRYHRAPSRFESDRERDVVLALAGWRVLRFTYRQVTERAGWVAAAIRAALARPSPWLP